MNANDVEVDEKYHRLTHGFLVWWVGVRIITVTTENSDLKHFGKNLFLTARKLLIILGRRGPKTSICQNGTLKNLLSLFAFQVVLTADKNGNSTWWRNFLITKPKLLQQGGRTEVDGCCWSCSFLHYKTWQAGGVQTVPSDRGYIDSKFAKTDQETLVVSLILMIPSWLEPEIIIRILISLSPLPVSQSRPPSRNIVKTKLGNFYYISTSNS